MLHSYTRTHVHNTKNGRSPVYVYECMYVCGRIVVYVCTAHRHLCVHVFVVYAAYVVFTYTKLRYETGTHTHTLFATTPKQRRHIIWLIHHYAEFTELVFAVICSRRPNMEWIRYYGDCISYIKCTSWRKPPALNILAAFCIYLARFFRKYIFIGHDLFIIFFLLLWPDTWAVLALCFIISATVKRMPYIYYISGI